MKNVGRVIFINILILLALVIFIESASRVFLYFTRGYSAIGLGERKKYLSYKPFVMFGPDWDEKLSPSLYPKTGAYRILLMGGSTAGGFPEQLLNDAFHDRFPGYKFEVIKLAAGGYNARQELIVCAMWGPDLEPDMIISLDGANDLIHRLRMKKAGTFYVNQAYELIMKRPFLSSIVHVLRNSQFIHGLTRLKTRMNVGGVDQYKDAIPVYIQAQHSIDLLAKGMSASRIIVLQPFIAFKQPQSEAEAGFTAYQYREKTVKELYNLLDEELKNLAKRDDVLYIDGRKAFDGMEKTIFSDDLHFTSEEGYCILAGYIAGLVTEGMLAQSQKIE